MGPPGQPRDKKNQNGKGREGHARGGSRGRGKRNGGAGRRRERHQTRGRKPGNLLWSSTGPRSIDVVDFTAARLTELKELRKAVATTNGNRRVYQRLAWHQRRRTMSHSSRRIPKRLRTAHRKELQMDGIVEEREEGVKGKMRCRKYRRKASFLMARRRLRTVMRRTQGLWLETHIWHAKRFVMGEICGGRKVGLWPVDRGVRSGWKAASHGCVVHDASYLDVVEMVSKTGETALKNVLSCCLRGRLNGKEMADDVVRGGRMIETVFYHKGLSKAIGPVDILWRPNGKQVWMWMHPALTEEVITTLRSVTYSPDVEIHLLEYRTCRFEIIGPRAIHTLASIFHRAQSQLCDWNEICNLRSVASLPERIVLPLEVEDPRASFPPKKECMTRTSGASVAKTLVAADALQEDSSLWKSETRQMLSARAKHVDGAPFVSVPILCIQRPSSLRGGLGAGWTVILPGSWAMPFWIPLMYTTGARAIGIREMRQMATECQRPFFPHDFPDTEGSLRAAEFRAMEAERLYTRRPKSKRVNYKRYRISSPFAPDFERLFKKASHEYTQRTQDEEGEEAESCEPPTKRREVTVSSPWADTTWSKVKEVELEVPSKKRRELVLPSFRVIRGRENILQAVGLITGTEKNKKRHAPAQQKRFSKWTPKKPSTKREDESANKKRVNNSQYQGEIEISRHRELVRVCLNPISRGCPADNAIVCLPMGSDYEAYKMHGRRARGFREPLATRGNNSPTRKVVGYVTAGTYSLARGTGVATAFITLNAARRVLREHPKKDLKGSWREEERQREGLILFRNSSSLQYRFAIAKILVDD